MRKRMWVVFLIINFMLSNLFFVGCGSAENDESLHLYQGIPFETATQEAVLETLLKKTDCSFQFSCGELEVFEFGYPWTLQIDLKGKNKGISRILLSSAQTARVTPEDWPERLQADFLEFMDVESQLTQLYGKPDERFFFMETRKEKYMFPSGTWEIDQMLNVYQEYRVFHSFSLFGNVVLQTWVDSLDARYADKPLSRVMLFFYPETMPSASPILPFHPSQEH